MEIIHKNVTLRSDMLYYCLLFFIWRNTESNCFDYIYFWSVLFIYHSKAKFNLKSRYDLALVSSDSQLRPQFWLYINWCWWIWKQGDKVVIEIID